MGEPKRATVYFDPDLHRALRLRAAATDRSVSDVVGQAVRALLADDVEDAEDAERRWSEPDLDFEEVVRDLRRRGRL